MVWLIVLLSILIIIAIVIFTVLLLLKEKDTPRIFKKSRSSSDTEQANTPTAAPSPRKRSQFRSSTEVPHSTEKPEADSASSTEQPGQQRSSYSHSSSTSSESQPEVPPSDISLSGLSQDAAWLSIRTREYEQGIQVSYDTALDAISIVFTRCRPRTSTEVTLAIQILYEQTNQIIKARGVHRYAFIVDIAGLFIGESIQQVWQHTFKAFFNTLSKEVDKGIYLLCVYNSNEPAKSQEAIKKRIAEIRLMTPATLHDTQNSIFDSREEAIACLNRLKELATSKTQQPTRK